MSGCRFGGAVLSCVGDGASERASRMGWTTGRSEANLAFAGAADEVVVVAGAVVGGGGRGEGVDACIRISGGAGPCP